MARSRLGLHPEGRIDTSLRRRNARAYLHLDCAILDTAGHRRGKADDQRKGDRRSEVARNRDRPFDPSPGRPDRRYHQLERDLLHRGTSCGSRRARGLRSPATGCHRRHGARVAHEGRFQFQRPPSPELWARDIWPPPGPPRLTWVLGSAAARVKTLLRSCRGHSGAG